LVALLAPDYLIADDPAMVAAASGFSRRAFVFRETRALARAPDNGQTHPTKIAAPPST